MYKKRLSLSILNTQNASTSSCVVVSLGLWGCCDAVSRRLVSLSFVSLMLMPEYESHSAEYRWQPATRPETKHHISQLNVNCGGYLCIKYTNLFHKFPYSVSVDMTGYVCFSWLSLHIFVVACLGTLTVLYCPGFLELQTMLIWSRMIVHNLISRNVKYF